jgi:hypothetical protein
MRKQSDIRSSEILQHQDGGSEEDPLVLRPSITRFDHGHSSTASNSNDAWFQSHMNKSKRSLIVCYFGVLLASVMALLTCTFGDVIHYMGVTTLSTRLAVMVSQQRQAGHKKKKDKAIISLDDIDKNQIIADKALKRLNDKTAIQYLPPKKCTVTVLIARHCNDYGMYAKDDEESGDKHCSYVGYERTRYFASRFGGHGQGGSTNKAYPQHQQQQHRWPSPIGLYALLPEPGKRGGINYRQIETLLPLAKQSKRSIHVVGEPEHVTSSIFEQLNMQKHMDHRARPRDWHDPHDQHDPHEYDDQEFNMPTMSRHDHHDPRDPHDPARDQDYNIKDDSTTYPYTYYYCGQVFVVAWKHASIQDVAAALGCGANQGCPNSYPDEEFDLVWQLRFVHEPPAPEDEVPWLVDQKSSLIVDDYNLLSQEQEQEYEHELFDPATKDKNSPYRHKSHSPGWTVYGTVTNQNFDPLHVSYHQQQFTQPVANDDM